MAGALQSHADSNGLTSVPNGTLPKLEFLNIASNNTDESLCQKYPKLKTISIAQNNLSFVFHDIFTGCKYLGYIDLSGNFSNLYEHPINIHNNYMLSTNDLKNKEIDILPSSFTTQLDNISKYKKDHNITGELKVIINKNNLLCLCTHETIESIHWFKNTADVIFEKEQFIYLFGVLRRFQHCTGHITTGSWKGRGNQYIEFARVVYCKLPTNGKQLPAFPHKAFTGIEPRPQRWEARVLPLCHRGPFENEQVTCSSLHGVKLLNLIPVDAFTTTCFHPNSNIILHSIIGMACVIIVILIAAVYRYRWRIQFTSLKFFNKLSCNKIKSQSDDDDDDDDDGNTQTKYDAFVSYCSDLNYAYITGTFHWVKIYLL